MGNLINIQSNQNINFLNYKSLLKDNPTINFSAEGVSSNYEITSEAQVNINAKSFKTTLFQNVVDGVYAQFDFGDALEFTTKKTGSHTFSFYLMQGDINAVLPYNVDVKLKVYINSILTHTFINNVNLESYSNDIRLAQSFSLNLGDVVNFAFEVEKPSVGKPNPNIELYFTCFQCNYGGVIDYYEPLEQLTGWQSKVDTINTQNLKANTDNLISFTGTDASNGGLTLMNRVGKIIPIKMGDALAVDFVFTFPSPAGTTDYLSVKLKVNGVVYRAQSFNILEPTGETNYVAVSFNLPVETDFYTYGAEFFVNPNVAITISNRYLQVTRVHKGV